MEPTPEELEAIEAELASLDIDSASELSLEDVIGEQSAIGADTRQETVGIGNHTEGAMSTEEVVGDEAVGGTVIMPEQDVVDDLGRAVGLEMDDRAFLRTTDILDERDDRRWELEPTSSEDYSDRRNEEA